MLNFYKRIQYDSQAFLKAMLWEFKFIFRDKAVLFSFIGVATIVSFIYTYLYSHEILTELPIAVVDMDNTSNSRKLLRMIDASSELKINGYYTDLNEAKSVLNAEKAKGIIYIPNHFSRDLQKELQPVISLYSDASYMLYHKQILTSVKTSVAYLNTGIQIKKVLAQGNLKSEALNSVMPVKGESVNLYNISSGYATFLIPIVLVIIFQTTMLTSIGILSGGINEKKQMRHLYPHANHFLGTLPIIMGKATTYLVLCFIILCVMTGVVIPIFNIPFRTNLLPLLVFMIPFFLSIVYLGIFLSLFFNKREDAIMLIMFTSIPALLMTGYSWPMSSTPTWIQAMSYLIPSTLGAKGFIGLSQLGNDFASLQPVWIKMWCLCIFYLILALLASKKLYIQSFR